MNNRAEVDVAQLLEDSIDTLNSSAANSNSPARYGIRVYNCTLLNRVATMLLGIRQPWFEVAAQSNLRESYFCQSYR